LESTSGAVDTSAPLGRLWMMAEWVYKATRARRSLEDTRALAIEHGFIARSAHGVKRQWIANVRIVAPGDVIHFYYREKKAVVAIGSFRVLEGAAQGARFESVVNAELVMVPEIPENADLLGLLKDRPDHPEGAAYKPDPVLGLYTGWRVEPTGLAPPTHRKSLFPGRGTLQRYDRITIDPKVMGGKACVRGLRVTVGTIVELVAAGHPVEEILGAYPYLEGEDIPAALRYAAWRAQEQELPLSA
jgi:uncharacterized protein (DUF433 family)